MGVQGYRKGALTQLMRGRDGRKIKLYPDSPNSACLLNLAITEGLHRAGDVLGGAQEVGGPALFACCIREALEPVW